MKVSILSLLLALSVTLTAIAQQPNHHPLRGTITDPSGAVISGLRLIRSGDKGLNYVTDLNGDFSIDLPVGEHTLTIDSADQYDFLAFIKITEKGPNPTDVHFVVKSGKACCTSSSGVAFPKPVALPKPKYPPVARAVRAAGEVTIAVKIDRTGRVISATAETGHPLLRAAAEAAARTATFEPSETDDREARLTYVFVPDGTEKVGLKRYTSPYRVEIVSETVTIDTSAVRARN